MRAEPVEVLNIDLDPGEFFKTNDMAAVTFLKLKGHPVQVIAWQGTTCYWVFRVTDQLLEDNEIFSEGAAAVEPREYSKLFAQTKREFYDSKNSLGRKK